jgi:hypothetical protein
MILKGSQRQGARRLAVHLLNERDNDHVTVAELRGFASGDLFGAMAEVEAVAKGTKCRQPLFSLSLNPPKGAEVGMDGFVAAADRAESALGLEGQPRAVVIHEKDGRLHAHVVWSRIDAEHMRAVNLPFFKRKLAALSKDLYLENDWALPDGHKAQGGKNPLNFTLAEWQQAKRQDLDPREIKQVFVGAWQRSDNLASFKNALEEQGYFLARGDRRGFVAVDLNGELYAVSRYAGVKATDVARKLGSPDALPSVIGVYNQIGSKVTDQVRAYLKEDRAAKASERAPLAEAAKKMAQAHRVERAHLNSKQAERWKAETQARAGRFRRGMGVVLDVVTGRYFALRRQNEFEAFHASKRDQVQREELCRAQLKERASLQKRIDALKSRQRRQRMELARDITATMRRVRENRAAHARERNRGPTLEL